MWIERAGTNLRRVSHATTAAGARSPAAAIRWRGRARGGPAHARTQRVPVPQSLVLRAGAQAARARAFPRLHPKRAPRTTGLLPLPPPGARPRPRGPVAFGGRRPRPRDPEHATVRRQQPKPPLRRARRAAWGSWDAGEVCLTHGEDPRIRARPRAGPGQQVPGQGDPRPRHRDQESDEHLVARRSAARPRQPLAVLLLGVGSGRQQWGWGWSQCGRSSRGVRWQRRLGRRRRTSQADQVGHSSSRPRGPSASSGA